MGSDEPTPPPQPQPEENFNIFDDEEQDDKSEDDVSTANYPSCFHLASLFNCQLGHLLYAEIRNFCQLISFEI